MKMTAQEFIDWKSKRITLLAMSGAGKTTLADKLPNSKWYHYSGDYRIGTKYLKEPILDNIKRQAMSIPFLRELLRADSLYIKSKISFDNLTAISSFLGKLGNSEKGGLSLKEFKYRQNLHRHAEIEAMKDVPAFIHNAEDIYGYHHFINDAGGSVCELDSLEALESLAENTLIIYIKIPPELEQTIIDRARKEPKPLYYRDAFLDEQLTTFLAVKNYNSTDEMSPDEFVSWVFPQLFKARVPRYEAIAEQYGYTIDGNDMAKVENEEGFIALIADALAKQTG